uniref:Arylsulfatase I-like n=1 Tax=Diabrotica virgifera virgifera TaxID=50390 RepID=A0A6P7FT84_DIAVI
MIGWNDVSFHGSGQIPTPNIDALAYSGLILQNYYVNPICTPSRSALMTGKHPIHTGMQHTVLFGAEARGLPLTEKLLPQYLEELGYENHIVGKWHLGSYKLEYTPMFRGFKSHLGKYLERFTSVITFNISILAVLTKLDDSVGSVTKALYNAGKLENTIIIFSSDNGGPAAGFNLNAASNYPLRGVKNTLWEGGIRAAGLLWSPLIKKPQRVASQRFHITDWLPTLVDAAGGDSSKITNIDGKSQWTTLSNDQPSTRNEILHNIDDIYGNAALTVGPWKLLKGTTYNGTWDSWYGPSGRDYEYNETKVINSLSGQALKHIKKAANGTQIKILRKQATVDCAVTKHKECNLLEEVCLYNIENDPCELNNVATNNPSIVRWLTDILNQYNRTAIPPGNLPLDPRGNPKYWNYVWTNFGDYIDISI